MSVVELFNRLVSIVFLGAVIAFTLNANRKDQGLIGAQVDAVPAMDDSNPQRMAVQFEIQKYIDEQWRFIHSLLDSLKVLKMQPHIYLYTMITPEELAIETSHVQQLIREIDFNEKQQQQFSQFVVSPLYLLDFELQNFQLKISLALNRALIFRGQHNLKEAMSRLDECFKLIEEYQIKWSENSLRGFINPDTFYALAYYHKGKIHRVMAGVDEDQLDQYHLLACETNYLAALNIKPDCFAIYASLGFLYRDMKQHSNSIKYFELAHQLEPTHPTPLHGIAVSHYFLGSEREDKAKKYDSHEFIIAEECFKQAIKLYGDSTVLSGSVYVDYGKLQMLMGRYDKALSFFNQGLKIQPEHSLLLMARGLLLERIGKKQEGLKDLKKGLALARNTALNRKYIQALEHAQHNQLPLDLVDHIPEKSSLCNQYENRDALELFFTKCAEYASSTGKPNKKPTCFISYAWGDHDEEKWVIQFAEDLEKAGIEVLLDRWCIRAGQDLMGYVEKMLVDDTDAIIVVGTNQYLKKCQFTTSNPNELERVSKVETRILNYMVRFNELTSDKIIPVLLEGTAVESLPPMVRMKETVDFTGGNYDANMYRLIRDIHQISQRDKIFESLKNILKK